MALITLTGYPSSGKTRRAEQLKAVLEARIQDPSYAGPQLKVTILSDEALNLERVVYKGGVRARCISNTILTSTYRWTL